jgi:hypothetical protein
LFVSSSVDSTIHRGPDSLQGKDLFINGAANSTIFICDHIGAMRIHHVKVKLIAIRVCPPVDSVID